MHSWPDQTTLVHSRSDYLRESELCDPLFPVPPTLQSDKERRDEQEALDKQRRHVLPDLRIPLRAAPGSPPHVTRLPPATSVSHANSNRIRRLVRWTRGPGTGLDGSDHSLDGPGTGLDGPGSGQDASHQRVTDEHQDQATGRGGHFVTCLATIPASASSTRPGQPDTVCRAEATQAASTNSQADSGGRHGGSPTRTAPTSQKNKTGRTKQGRLVTT